MIRERRITGECPDEGGWPRAIPGRPTQVTRTAGRTDKLWAFWVFVPPCPAYLANIVTLGIRAAAFAESGADDRQLARSITVPPRWSSAAPTDLPAVGGCRWKRSAASTLIALILGCALYAVMGAYLMRLELAAGFDTAIGGFAGLLACVSTVMARAIAVPSTSRRTLIGSIVAMLSADSQRTLFASGGSW